MVYFQTSEVLYKIMHQGTNVHLHFDIGNLGQPFHQTHSELALERRSGTLT